MNLKAILKILISLGMLLVVFQLVDFPTLKKTVLEIPVGTALLVVLGYFLGQIISAFKWAFLARASGMEVHFINALKAYFIGMYVNCFGFGIVGGDVTRGVLLAERKQDIPRAVATVVADRTHGLAVLAFLGTCATLIFGRGTLDPQFVYLLTIIGAGIVLAWILGPKILLRMVPQSNALRTKAEEVSQAFPKARKTVILVTLISIVFHLLQIALHWIMGLGLSVDLAWTYLLIVIPFVNILSSLPISWQGLGVREGAYIYFLCPQPLSEEQAVAMGAMWILAATASSAVGGVVAFMTKDFSNMRKQAVGSSV